jgi:hypothetical protein
MPIIYNGGIASEDERIPDPVLDGNILVGNASGGFDFQPLSSVIEGITYSWANAAERTAQTGMVSGELGVQRDTGDVWKYDGISWSVFFNLQDGAGASAANMQAVVVPFAFNTASPLTVRAMVNGESVLDSEIVITQVFDDPAAVLALGTVASPSALIPNSDNDPQTLGTYGSDENINFTGAETVRLTITPGTSTQGVGFVILIVKRA